jgi:hypothetical protein
MRRNGYANISACGKYRYELGGELGPDPYGTIAGTTLIPTTPSITTLPSGSVYTANREPFFINPAASRQVTLRMILWLMLNPSTADASHDDQTIRTICVFSEAWGYHRVMVGNLYAYRTKDPKELFRAAKSGVDVVGPDNDRVLAEMVGRSRTSGGIVMAAWGGNARPDRVKAVQSIAGGRLQCLKVNKDGSPVHPLYQPHKLTPITWEGMPSDKVDL